MDIVKHICSSVPTGPAGFPTYSDIDLDRFTNIMVKDSHVIADHFGLMITGKIFSRLLFFNTPREDDTKRWGSSDLINYFSYVILREDITSVFLNSHIYPKLQSSKTYKKGSLKNWMTDVNFTSSNL